MKTLYFSVPTVTRKFCSDSKFDHSYEKSVDIDFSNFDGKIYKINFIGSDYYLYFSSKKDYNVIFSKILDLEKFANRNIFTRDNLLACKSLLRAELKKYRGDYKINFSKIKKKYKKLKNKIIENFFWSLMNKKEISNYISNEFGGFLPVDLEKCFKDFICRKQEKTWFLCFERTTPYKFISIFS